MTARRLLIRCSGFSPVELLPGGRLNLGRHSSNDLVLSDDKISRFHASVVWPAEGPPLVLDNNSTNGVAVNGVRVRKQQALQPGDEVGVGPFTLTIEAPDAPAPRPAPAPAAGGARATRALPGAEGEAIGREEVQKLLCELEDNSWTGTLEVQAGFEALAVSFCLGRITAAEGPGGASGLGILNRVITSRRLSYRFRPLSESGGQGTLELSVRDYLRQFGSMTSTHAD